MSLNIQNALLFEVRYITKIYDRRSTCGGQDSEPNGSHLEEKTFHVLTHSIRLAEAAFHESHGHLLTEPGCRITSGPKDVTPWFNLYTLL